MRLENQPNSFNPALDACLGDLKQRTLVTGRVQPPASEWCWVRKGASQKVTLVLPGSYCL